MTFGCAMSLEFGDAETEGYGDVDLISVSGLSDDRRASAAVGTSQLSKSSRRMALLMPC